MRNLTLALALVLLCATSHAAVRPGAGSGTTPKPTTPPPTMPAPPPTGGGSPTVLCERFPALCVQ